LLENLNPSSNPLNWQNPLLHSMQLEPIKQPIELAESFASLDATAHLIYVGSGVLEIELKERFDSNPNFHFVGFQNQSIIPIWYRVGNVLCLPSKSETWGLAVNEALACGCKVIVSDRVGCAEDLVNQKSHGAVFRWNEAQSLHNALKDFFNSKDPKREGILIAGLKDFAAALIQEMQETQQ